jgi:hypothetical protein
MTTLELLEKITDLGYDRSIALDGINKLLDSQLAERKPIEKEELNSELSDKIFWSFFLRGAEKTWNGKDVPVEKEFDLIGGNQI